MSVLLQIVAIIICMIMFYGLFMEMKKKRLSESSALLWLMGVFGLLVVSCFPSILEGVAGLFGVWWAPAMLIFFLLMVVIIIIFYHTISISALEAQLMETSMQLSLLKEQNNEFMKKILMIIPAYNEEENIGRLLEDISKQGLQERMDILVIDDGSKDNAARIVTDMGFKVIRQLFNMGYGAALQTGYKYAVEYGYDYLIQIDADGQHDLKNIDIICERMGCESDDEGDYPDIIIGSRFLEGSKSFYISRLKKIAINFFRFIIKRNTGCVLTDPTSGLQGLSRRAFSFYAQYGNFDLKYPDMNMVIQMLLLKYKIEEFPALMHERVAGTSMHGSLLKVGKYMALMSLSSLNAYFRYKKRDT